MQAMTNSGAKAIFSPLTKDPKTGFWTQKVTGYEQSDPFTDYENQLKTQQKFDEIGAKYGKSYAVNALNGGAGGVSAGGTNSNSSATAAGGLGVNGIGDITNTAKDLAQFRLGLDKDMGNFSFGLRDTEANNNLGRQKDLEGFQAGLGETRAQSDFGRTTKLTDQNYGWQQRLNQDTQNALTARNDAQLKNQRDLQTSDQGFQNFNTQRAVNLASRRLGG